jgi:hypothetical protein
MSPVCCETRRQSLPIFHAKNTAPASVILADPLLYAGLPLIWAQLFLERQQESEQQQHVFEFDQAA